MHTHTLLIPGPVGALEAAVETHPSPQGLAIICHPHPLHQGTMHNKVVTTAARAMYELGCTTMRFNYRGVGKSEGSYGNSVGETEDAYAVWQYCKQHYEAARTILIGFSFGSYIAASLAKRILPNVVLSIAPAIGKQAFDALITLPSPWIGIIGEADELFSIDSVSAFFEKRKAMGYPTAFQVLPKAGHFFHGQLPFLKETLCEYVRPYFN